MALLSPGKTARRLFGCAVASLMFVSCGSSGTATTTKPSVETTQAETEPAGPTIGEEDDVPEETTVAAEPPIEVESLAFNIPEGWVALQPGDDVSSALRSSPPVLHQELSNDASKVQRIADILSDQDMLVLSPKGDIVSVLVATTGTSGDVDKLAASIDKLAEDDGMDRRYKIAYDGPLGVGFFVTHTDPNEGVFKSLLVDTGQDLFIIRAPGQTLEIAHEALDKVIESTELNT